MAEFQFHCLGVHPELYAAAPTLVFRLRITEQTGVPVQAIMLRCQIRIQPALRRYSQVEQALLGDLFGEPTRWHETLKPLQFAFISLVVPRFQHAIEVDLPVPCTYDLEVASAKYCSFLETGEVPLLLLFSGTAFLEAPTGFTVEQLSWEGETAYRLPVAVWRALMDHYFPGSGWIRLSRETIAALQRYKADQALPTWEATIQQLLTLAERGEL